MLDPSGFLPTMPTLTLSFEDVTFTPICEPPVNAMLLKLYCVPVPLAVSTRLMQVSLAEVIQIELLGGLLLHSKQVPYCVSAHHMADFLGGVFDMVGSPLNRLCHGDHMHALRSAECGFRFEMADDHEVVQAIHFAVCAYDLKRQGMIAAGKRCLGIGQHFGQHRQHIAEIPEIFHVQAGVYGFRARSKGEQQIADALEIDHALQASELLPDLLDGTVGEFVGYALGEFAVEFI